MTTRNRPARCNAPSQRKVALQRIAAPAGMGMLQAVATDAVGGNGLLHCVRNGGVGCVDRAGGVDGVGSQ